MRKVLVLLLSVGMLFLVGCNTIKEAESEVESLESSLSSVVEENLGSSEEEKPIEGENKLYSAFVKEKFSAIEKDSYKELLVDAYIKTREATLPGQVVTVTISIKNNGDKTVIYPVGSGANIVPDALVVMAEGLQTLPHKEQLGAVTMDMKYDTIKPGESKEFTVYIMAIKENANFIQYALDDYIKTQKYLGENDTAEFLKEHSDLEVAEAKSYKTTVYFEYKAADGAEEPIISGDDTSYNSFEFDINIA